jgi:hypothetical protein
MPQSPLGEGCHEFLEAIEADLAIELVHDNYRGRTRI